MSRHAPASITVAAIGLGLFSSMAAAKEIRGRVELGGQPLAQAAVVLWATTGDEAPREIATTTTRKDGLFRVSDHRAPKHAVLYLVARDVSSDPAGNAWVANNWNVPAAAGDADPARPTSTWGGGSGITVIYGVAAPVKTPLMGQVRAN